MTVMFLTRVYDVVQKLRHQHNKKVQFEQKHLGRIFYALAGCASHSTAAAGMIDFKRDSLCSMWVSGPLERGLRGTAPWRHESL